MMHRVRYAWLALGVLSTGCKGCADENEPRVPFKLGAAHHENAPHDAGPRPEPTLPAGQPALSQSYTPPIDRPVLEGATLAADLVRATLVLDLDGDGDRDALALLDDGQGHVRLAVSTRDAQGFGAPADVGQAVGSSDPTCAVDSARLDALSTDKGVLTLSASCGEPKLPRPPSYSLLSLEVRPRVYERIELSAPPDASAPALSLSPTSADVDSDGHADVVLSLALGVAGAAPGEALALPFLDRPSGLVRDAREPEATFAAWASAAEEAVNKGTAQEAIARAEAVQHMRRALCREAGAPLWKVGGAEGIACGPQKSSTSAALVLVLAHAKEKRVAESALAYRSLLRSDPKPDARLLAKAHAALRTLPTEPRVTLQKGPDARAVSAVRVHLPLVRFVEETTLLVQSSPPLFVPLDGQPPSPAADASDALVRDPSGQLAVTAVERTCEGYALRVERAEAPGQPYTPTPAVSTPMLLALARPPGCTSLPEAERRDSGDFQVLGWAPQGVVVARGSELLLVPLDLSGKPAGPARALDPSAPVPAPLALGAATPDGSRHVEATPFGVLVYEGAGVTLLRPDGYDAIAQGASDAAISPSGARVVVLSGGNAYVLTRAAANPM